ncbi:hypothetical protein [Microbacterium esteraromaticum]|uniref:hypothetical protein n=2 Tax=Microbacteriaceae TaxID=85023 RepID=UPI000F5D84C4|nr:hypothetical protein CSX12_12160 [Microbacterium sp. Y-01]
MAPVGKAYGMANQRYTIKVLCRGTSRHAHSRREIARYEWSESGTFWDRIDHADSGKDWAGGMNDEGKIEIRPRPVFECQCGNRPVYTHDELQQKLQLAADEGKHLTV